VRLPGHHQPLAGLDLEDLAVNNFEVAVADISVGSALL